RADCPAPLCTYPLQPVEQCHARSSSGLQLPRIGCKPALASPMLAAVMTTDYEALMKNGNWTLVSLPPNRYAIGCK
ncbi:hypothetical protein L195_g035574, partial [Trifolium pratense]